MKRISLISIIALVLASVICVALVSCKDSKNIASADIVNYVVDEAYTDIYVDSCQFAEELATGTPSHDVEDQMSDYFYNEYGDVMGYIDVFAGPYDNNSVGVRMGDDEEDIKEDVKITNISYSDADGTTRGDFTLSCSGYFQGQPATMKVEGKFTFGGSNDSIVFSSTVFNGVDYDIDAFNKKMEEKLH